MTEETVCRSHARSVIVLKFLACNIKGNRDVTKIIQVRVFYTEQKYIIYTFLIYSKSKIMYDIR